MTGFSDKLIRWYSEHKRDLPWRHTRDPYRVWLSEVILQQTRVDQGLAYYYRFLDAFPDVFALASASEDEVLKNWQGLGYYSRARNLHASAKKVASEYGGEFPKNAQGLMQLKGVGSYTAAAIASFCFDEAVPVVDGNVMRVLARIFAICAAVDKPVGRKVIEAIAEELIDPKNPGLFNQAIMEFGALHCTPAKPSCDACPFQSECMARRDDAVENYPVKSAKTQVRDIWMHYFYVVQDGDVWVRRREHSGIWRGLYEFPLVEASEALSPDDALEQFIGIYHPEGTWKKEGVSAEFVHLLSHRKIHAFFTEVQASDDFVLSGPGLKRLSHADFKACGIPRLLSKYLETLA